MSYHQFQIFEKIGTEESQIAASIELSERTNLFVKQNTYFLSNSPKDLILSCINISFTLLYFGMPKNLYEGCYYMQFLVFSLAVTVALYHIVEQYMLEQKDLNKVHFTSGEHLANFIDKILMFASSSASSSQYHSF